jgi:hypothetical protein
MERMTRDPSEGPKDARLVSPKKVGDGGFGRGERRRPCRKNDPSSIRRRHSDGRSNDRTLRSQCAMESKCRMQLRRGPEL